VGRGGALVALDRGSEAVWAADDGGPRLWWRSGEGWCSGEEMAVGMQSREDKKECVGSSRRCLGSRRRRGCAKTGAGGRRESWRLGRRRRDMERQEQASAGRGSGGAGIGAACGTVRAARGGRCSAHGGEAAAARRAEGNQSRAEQRAGGRRRTDSEFSKNIGTPL
jgi:hypothetical protein